MTAINMTTQPIGLSDQSRWNEDYGRANLALIEENPQQFLIGKFDYQDDLERELVHSLGSVSGKRILEMGSGRGHLSVLLAKRGARVTGVDIGPDLTALSRKVAALNNVRCEFVTADIATFDVPVESFDLVVGSAILHHIPLEGVRATLDRAFRSLTPGGTATFLEPVENSKTFAFLQNVIPVPGYRPSILNRQEWKVYVAKQDDRDMTDRELREAGRQFSRVSFQHIGFLIRLCWFIPGGRKNAQWLEKIDRPLMKTPLKRFSQSVIVTYQKN